MESERVRGEGGKWEERGKREGRERSERGKDCDARRNWIPFGGDPQLLALAQKHIVFLSPTTAPTTHSCGATMYSRSALKRSRCSNCGVSLFSEVEKQKCDTSRDNTNSSSSAPRLSFCSQDCKVTCCLLGRYNFSSSATSSLATKQSSHAAAPERRNSGSSTASCSSNGSSGSSFMASEPVPVPPHNKQHARPLQQGLGAQ